MSELSNETIALLVEKSFEAQAFAHCPYSKFPVGAALLCDDGSIYIGKNSRTQLKRFKTFVRQRLQHRERRIFSWNLCRAHRSCQSSVGRQEEFQSNRGVHETRDRVREPVWCLSTIPC